MQQSAKTPGNARVQRRVFGEMLLRRKFAKPEIEDVLCVRGKNISQIGLQRFMGMRK
nr:hypothetical protein [Simplicispira suum]